MAKLFLVQTRDEETTGEHGHYSTFVRAESHEEAAQMVVADLLEGDPDEDPGYEDEVAVLHVSRTEGPLGMIPDDESGWEWETFSLDKLVKVWRAKQEA
jgi:hypothetical protein